MKKIIAIIIILQITTNSFSQISYGIAGGINISHVTEKTNGRPTFTTTVVCGTQNTDKPPTGARFACAK